MLCGGLSVALAAEPTLNTEFSLGYDDNVSNSEHDDDSRSSRFAIAGVRLDHSINLAAQDSLLLRAGLQGEAHDGLSALNNAKLSGMIRFTHSPLPGSSVPTLSVWGAAATWEFNSELRDSSEYRVGVFLTQPLRERLSARLSLTGSRRNADNPVFDLRGVSAAADLDWHVTPTLTVYGGLQFHDGDVVSSATATPTIRDVAEERSRPMTLSTLWSPIGWRQKPGFPRWDSTTACRTVFRSICKRNTSTPMRPAAITINAG